nr:hypothetical protein [Natronococcus sp. AD5]
MRCDGGSNLYTCDTPGCSGWKEVITPDGYVCHDCADKLEKQYERGENAKLLADGGITQQFAVDHVDPQNLTIEQKPALVETRDSLVYVADVKLRDSGWLYYREWCGDSGYLPPHQVSRIKFVPTEWNDDRDTKRVADEEMVRQAISDREGST